MAGAGDIAMLVGVLGVAAVVIFAAVVSWRIVRRLKTLHARIRRVIPPTLLIVPGPVIAATAWTHLHKSWFDARVISSTGPKRQTLVLRRNLWQHVDAANAALSQAQVAEAPLGELPRLARQLGNLAHNQDRQLALLTSGSAVNDLEFARAETDRIVGCADEITGAAIEALRSIPDFNANHLESVIKDEVQAVRAGSARLQSIWKEH